ncbi:MAG TPA: Ig-like domain-containing protein [Solirubrobacteraceae bacterium]|nr:Ig-like domain-containing protein [Solirubrobacteraceae bacterium]
MARTAWAWLRYGGRRAALALLLAAGLGAWAGTTAGAPAFASGERGGESGGSPGETATTGTSTCPSSNPPDQLTLVGGTPQTTTLDTAFASGLQVALTNSDGCAVTGAAGVPVTFSAPAAGASGRFSTSNSNTATVGADASGSAAAPTFTANTTAGSYTVTASSQYGSVSFSLTNTAAGTPAKLTAIPLKHRSARVTARFPQPLQVRVLDANGNPVAGATVTFTLDPTSTSTCGTTAAATASFAGGGTQATATTDANGLATSPAFTANTAAGSFTATALVSSGGGDGSESPGKAAAPTITPVSFSLSNLAGKPTKLAPGVGSTQSTPAGTPFPIRLAVTVTDAQKNPVPGALVTFSAPAVGGLFTLRSRGPHHRAHVAYAHTVAVKTGACGIAVAPPFTASHKLGGYVVEASAKPARPAAFALVNEAP